MNAHIVRRNLHITVAILILVLWCITNEFLHAYRNNPDQVAIGWGIEMGQLFQPIVILLAAVSILAACWILYMGVNEHRA